MEVHGFGFLVGCDGTCIRYMQMKAGNLSLSVNKGGTTGSLILVLLDED